MERVKGFCALYMYNGQPLRHGSFACGIVDFISGDHYPELTSLNISKEPEMQHMTETPVDIDSQGLLAAVH
jgi:hypothetical protein